MELKSIKKFDRVLALVLTIAALLAGQSVWAASTFTVSSPQNNNTFRITRTGNTAVSETIDWRVVSLSAIAGVHFTGYNGNYSGTVTFNVNDTYKDVTISESNPGDNAYKYQNGTTRSYRFEVLDRNGDILASCDRSRSYGTSVPSSGAFAEKDITIYTDEVQYSDAGYNKGNNPHYINSSSYYNLSGIAPVAYYTLIGAQLRSTLSFDAKEKNNGYQYVQVLINNTSTCDDRSDCSNGDPGNINLSRYMAGFDHDPGGKNTTYAAYTFPVLSAGNNCSTVTNAWSNGVDNKLYTQKFNTSCRATDGRLILPLDFNTLVVRFNASGGGTDNDEWYAKNVKAHIQAVDATAPTVLSNYKVSGGRHQKGNVIYVSVAFSEIVTVSGTPTLATSWGTLSYCAGSGTNVLTFSGTIGSDATGTLSVTAHSGTITDLAGNALSGTVSHAFATALDDDYAWTAADFNSLGTNTYEIATKTDLRHLALLVNAAKNPCSGLTFQQTQDITCDSTYTPIGYYVSGSDEAEFLGTYDGQGYTISGITVSREADGYIGVFCRLDYVNSTDYGTVKNVVLASSIFTGGSRVGGIVGYNRGGTVENCRVESTVTINAGNNYAHNHGGIVGYNVNYAAKVIGCYSAATISKNGKINCQYYGGIVGYNYHGTVKDCLYAGTTVTAANKKGAIIGYDEYNYGVFSNNYYTAISLGGVGADGSSSDRDGARRARTVSLGTGVALSGTQTVYDVSGLTAVGTTALSHNDGTATTIYSGEGQTVGLAYTATVPDGFMVNYSATAGTLSGTTLTMSATDVEVSAATAPDYATHWHADADHDGTTAQRAYIISTTTGLNLLATLVNGTVSGYPANDFSGKFFLLGGNIEYSSGTDWDNTDDSNTENNFAGIGGVSGNTNYYFKGTFDGGGNTISGIRITQKNKDSQGLFGYIGTGGTVKDLTLSNARIFSNKTGVGGIAGDSHGTIANCHVTANVNILGNGNYHGGIAGNNYTGTITGCTSAAVLNGSGSYRGGITGQSSGGTLSDCIVTGLSYSYANSYAGAIVGKNIAGTLSNNYYHACSVNGATTNIGVGTSTAGLSNDVDGAKSVHALTLGADITATPGTVESVTISGTTYYTAGSTFTLSYTGTVPANHIVVYSVGTQALSGTTLTMSAADATVSAEVITKWDWLNRRFAAASTDEDFPTLITLTEDYTAEATDSYLTIPSGRYVTLDLNGFTLDRNLTEAKTDGYVIRAIGNLTVRDSDPNAVHSGTAITGGIITRGNSSDKGGGLYIYGGSNAFPSVTLEGGTIIGNGAGYGGGVYVENGRFYMTGGTISCNVARTYGGGVYVNTNSFFDMTGGTISGNVAKSDGGGVYAYTGSTFTMTGGTVSDNTAKIQGGGVYVYRSTFTLTDSEIADNDARNGGGIYVSSGILTMADGTITDNTATISGGGVYLSGTISASGTFTMTGGTITGNTANNGGGVYVSGNSTFNQESGVISTNAARKGGGVYISSSGSSFNLTDGTITGNTADLGNNGKGGGVFLNDGVFAISGGPAVTGNTNVYDDLADNIYLNTGNLITVGGLLTAGARMGVASYDLTGTFTYGGTFADDEAVLAVFFSDRIGYGIVADNGEAALATAYTVTIDPSIEHGTVTASLANAVAGQTVTLTVTPNAGYAINTVNYNDGTDHEITPSEGVYSFTMPASNIMVSATFAMTWASLNAAMQNGGTFTLPYDITATETDTYLYVPNDKTVTLDLNGHTINRNLTAAANNGHVIRVDGTLTINDSSDSNTGSITGGNSKNNCGGVYVWGALIMNGGNIISNTTTKPGGGVYVYHTGTFTMSGGTITGNNAEYGGGVYNDGTFNISGNPVITGNTNSTASKANNVYLTSGKVITVTGALTTGACIGVRMQDNTGVFTSGLNGNGTVANFTCDNSSECGVYLNGNGEASIIVDVWGIPDGADGSEAHPYNITTTRDLDLLATRVNSGMGYGADNEHPNGFFFQLGADITYIHKEANEEGADTEDNYTAIGASQNYCFRGTFDGKDHTISGIRIYKGESNFQGLFGYVIGGKVKNVTLSDAHIIGKQDVGGIVGFLTYYDNGPISSINNCHVDGTVTIQAVVNSAESHGGIAGASKGSVSNCTSSVTFMDSNGLTGWREVGGIVGYARGGTISNCLAVGVTIPAVSSRGAIVGVNAGSTLTANYYLNCTVGGNTTNVGNGSVDPNGARSVHSLTLADGVTASGESVTIGSDTYYASNTNVSFTYNGSIPRGYVLDIKVKDANNNDIAVTYSNDTYTFKMPACDASVSGITDVWGITNNPAADGSEEHPYIITSTTGLDLLAKNVNGIDGYTADKFDGKFFKLGNDITYAHTTDWNDATSTENNYTSIGIVFGKEFWGTFDGDGHTISGIRIYKGNDNSQGLFGYARGTVKNVTLSDARITGKYYVGGIVGYLTDTNQLIGTVNNCHVDGNVAIHTVVSDADDHGGIVGCSGTVINCTSQAVLTVADNLTGCDNYGGIVGQNDGNVSNGTSSATIIVGNGVSGSHFGGIVGQNRGSVSSCLAIGATIPNVGSKGAIAGRNDTNNGGTLNTNYYYNCTIGGVSNATSVGVGTSDINNNKYPEGAVAATILSESETVPSNLSGKVAFRREFTGGKASTICLPFALTKIEGGKVYEFVDVTYDAVDGWVATMNEVTATVANKPYLFLPEGSGSVPVLFHGTAGYDVSGGLATTSGDWTFTGTYTNLTYGTEPMTGHIYGFASKSKTVDGHDVEAGQFVHAKEGASVPPMRCYLTYKNGAQRAPMRASALGAIGTDTEVPSRITVRLVSAGGTVTAVGTLDTVTGEMDINTWYDMNGRLLETEPIAPGLYIHNGKTIMIKK